MRAAESVTISSSPDAAFALRWNRKDLLGLRELSAVEINFILDTADAFKQVGTREIKKVPALRGKTLVNFFVEPSTRTRTSFELAAFRLSADVSTFLPRPRAWRRAKRSKTLRATLKRCTLIFSSC